ncbi:hypothetical protein LE191_07370 [Janthinobacterium sp. HSC-3S05]|uniref:hypothetical protein n=1 Tax=Janthinobacterium lividum TaxID=29581 RepID=UPI001CD8F619|nr:hypothetical protein [Janthinobacterium lividum]MCA1859932.1 hypothetical protein [Janthinobacterium lividum]
MYKNKLNQFMVARLFREDFDDKLFACSSAEECESLFLEAMEVRLHLSDMLNRIMKECREKQDYFDGLSSEKENVFKPLSRKLFSNDEEYD